MILKKEWIIIDPIITINNQTENIKGNIKISSNFNSDLINNIFSNISSFDLITFYDLKRNYKRLGYSTDEITIQLLKLFSTPLFYGIYNNIFYYNYV